MNENNPAFTLKNYSASAIQALVENADAGPAPFGRTISGEPIAFTVGMNHITVPGYEGLYTCNAAGIYRFADEYEATPVFLLEPALFKDLPGIVIRYNGQPLAIEEYGDLNAIEFFEYLVESN